MSESTETKPLRFFELLSAHKGQRIMWQYTVDTTTYPVVYGRLQSADFSVMDSEVPDELLLVELTLKIRPGHWKHGMAAAVQARSWHVDWVEQPYLEQYELGPFQTVSSLEVASDAKQIADHTRTHILHTFMLESPERNLKLSMLL